MLPEQGLQPENAGPAGSRMGMMRMNISDEIRVTQDRRQVSSS
jgi:hypothetical protein